MPRWVRHVVSSTPNPFWRGGSTDTYADNCDDRQKTAVEGAFDTLNGNAGLNCFPELRDCMRDKWPDAFVDCCFDETRPPRGGQLQAFIFICNMTPQQMQVEICKGLVEMCGGKRLDVKAMLFSCFGSPEGTPSSSDFNNFLAEPTFSGNANEREGKFVIWNRDSGEVWNKTTTTTSGGFWRGDITTTSKGNRCFVDASWET